jgi:hypothetical protein
MIEVLYIGNITDEENSNSELDFAGKFAGASTVSFVFTAFQGGGSPDTCGVKVEVLHRDDPNTNPYEPVPNAVLIFSQPGATASSIVEVPAESLRAFGKIVLASTGTGNALGAGSVTAVW